jgi:hypothetical protein
VLDGGRGDDVLAGGNGKDTYIVDSIYDTVIEKDNQGVDTVNSTVNWTLSSNVENLTLKGRDAINGTGNSLDNTITGNDSNNTLDGGAGKDILAGGLGDDTYIVDSSGDVIRERADQGTDTVQSSISWSLGIYIENLTLAGIGNIDGTGNSYDNKITGNAGNNILDGKEGANTLTGLDGADTFVFSTKGEFGSTNATHITDFDGNEGDLIKISKIRFGMASDANTTLQTISNSADLNTALGSTSTFVYDSSNGNLYFNQNGSDAGAGAGGVFAVLDNHATLSESNIALS